MILSPSPRYTTQTLCFTTCLGTRNLATTCALVILPRYRGPGLEMG
jgi:hypothetical protein